MKDYLKLDPCITPLAWRSLKAAEPFLDDGRDVDQQLGEVVDLVRDQGMKYPGRAWRLQMIEGLRMRPAEWGAPTGEPDENLIMTGCNPLRAIDEILDFCRLVQRLGGRYTFLTTEYCCLPHTNALPVLRVDGAAREKWLETAGEYIGMNVVEAKRLGVKRIYYICHTCVYQARRFYGAGSDVPHLYYLDLVADLINKAQPGLRLPGKAVYFDGCHAKKCVYQGASACRWDIDWPDYRACLDRIEGLEVVEEIPKGVCCWTNPERVLRSAQKKHVSVAVTPCWQCVSRLGQADRRNRPYKGLSQILLQALS